MDLSHEKTLPHLWQRAAALAARCHHGQKRKDGATPYIAHPFRVAMIVRDLFGVDDEVALAAAILHDVIEDTTADYEDVSEACGTEVAAIVMAMTKDMRQPEKIREPAYDKQLAEAAWQAQLIKLADVYDNVCDAHTPGMRRKTLGKAPRAVAICGDDPRLTEPIRLLEKLVQRVKAVDA